MTTRTQIQSEAQNQNLKTSTVIHGHFAEVEYLVVEVKKFKSAFFKMDNNTFNFTYSHTYNALNDKTTYSKPKGF
jgi:alanine racemase